MARTPKHNNIFRSSLIKFKPISARINIKISCNEQLTVTNCIFLPCVYKFPCVLSFSHPCPYLGP